MAGSLVLRELRRVRGAGGGWQRGLELACGGWKTLWWAGRGARVDLQRLTHVCDSSGGPRRVLIPGELPSVVELTAFSSGGLSFDLRLARTALVR